MIDNNKLLKSITDYLYEQNVRSDCGIESLAGDLIEILANGLLEAAEEYVQRTDYDKVCAFLKGIGCEFNTDTSMITGNIINIKPESTTSFNSVAIEFYSDGSFKGFLAEDYKEIDL